ncbi:MAG: hypothetical protein HYT75_00205, partial [Deltaproteobacteria bacterium]|nr:hypothetical protein [Deltaproteobacteria bacterium]
MVTPARDGSVAWFYRPLENLPPLQFSSQQEEAVVKAVCEREFADLCFGATLNGAMRMARQNVTSWSCKNGTCEIDYKKLVKAHSKGPDAFKTLGAVAVGAGAGYLAGNVPGAIFGGVIGFNLACPDPGNGPPVLLDSVFIISDVGDNDIENHNEALGDAAIDGATGADGLVEVEAAGIWTDIVPTSKDTPLGKDTPTGADTPIAKDAPPAGKDTTLDTVKPADTVFAPDTFVAPDALPVSDATTAADTAADAPGAADLASSLDLKSPVDLQTPADLPADAPPALPDDSSVESAVADSPADSQIVFTSDGDAFDAAAPVFLGTAFCTNEFENTCLPLNPDFVSTCLYINDFQIKDEDSPVTLDAFLSHKNDPISMTVSGNNAL